MSGIAEAITVISCVAALVSAYRDGSTILEKIKGRRRERGGLPPTRLLEDELKKGEAAVQEAADDGVIHCGDDFEAGDGRSIIVTRRICTNRLDSLVETKVALLWATVEVQRTMLTSLREAVEDDSVDDFTGCIDSAHTARLKVVNALNGLQQRQQAEDHRRRLNLSQEAAASREQSAQIYKSPTREMSPSIDSSDPSSTDQPSRRLSFWKTKRQQTTQSDSHKTIDSVACSDTAVETLKSNSWNGLDLPMLSDRAPPHAHAAQPGVPGPHQTSSSPTLRRQDSSSTASHSTTDSSSSFCPSAYLLQASLPGGLKILNQSVAMSGSNHIFVCSSKKCVFEGPARREKNKWKYDDKIWDLHGFRFRWVLFAKSHVEQSKSKGGVRHFRCVVCSLKHGGTLPIIEGEGVLLSHLAQHSGEDMGGVLLRGPMRIGRGTLEACSVDVFDVFFADFEQLREEDESDKEAPPSPEIFRWADDAVSVLDGWRGS